MRVQSIFVLGWSRCIAVFPRTVQFHRHVQIILDRHSLLWSLSFINNFLVVINATSKLILEHFAFYNSDCMSFDVIFFGWSGVSFGEDGITEYVLGWIDEGERGVFFVIEQLYFEGFSFEVDDPAHFAVLSYIQANLPSWGYPRINSTHSYLTGAYFSRSKGTCLSILAILPGRSTSPYSYSSIIRLQAKQSHHTGSIFGIIEHQLA